MDDYASQDYQIVYDSCSDADKQTVDNLIEDGMSLADALAELGYQV